MDEDKLIAGFYQFGGKGDVWNNTTHISQNASMSTTLCGKPMLSTNHARIEKHKNIGCEVCLTKYNDLIQKEYGS